MLKNDNILEVTISDTPRTDGGVVREEVDAQGVGAWVDEARCACNKFVVFPFGEECLECGFLHANTIAFEAFHHFCPSFVVSDVVDDEDDEAASVLDEEFILVIVVLHTSHLIAAARVRRCRT